MGNFSGWDFPDMHAHLVEKSDTGRIKGGGKKRNIVLPAAFDQLRIYLKGEHQLGTHLQLAFRASIIIRIMLLILRFLCKNRDIEFGYPGLELDIVCSGSRSGFYHLLGNPDISVIVYTCFCDNCNLFSHFFSLKEGIPP